MIKLLKYLVGLFILLFIWSCKAQSKKIETKTYSMEVDSSLKTAIFGGGCFWCTEAVFLRLKGVISVESGYSGGDIDNPTYRQVSNGNTGHAEVIKINYSSDSISYKELLKVFFYTHDPTTLNRQGADEGTQYRSVIFTQNEEEKRASIEMINALNTEKVFSGPIVTQVEDLKNYYPAEDYHQNYYNNHPEQGYCRVVITPKIEKFEKNFTSLLSKDK